MLQGVQNYLYEGVVGARDLDDDGLCHDQRNRAAQPSSRAEENIPPPHRRAAQTKQWSAPRTTDSLSLNSAPYQYMHSVVVCYQPLASGYQNLHLAFVGCGFDYEWQISGVIHKPCHNSSATHSLPCNCAT